MPSPLEALQTLRFGNTPANDPLKLAGYRDKRLSDMTENLALEKKFPGRFFSGATPEAAHQLESDINSDPMTGLKAQADTADLTRRGQAAQLAGFQGEGDGGYGGAIQAQNKYLQQQEHEKMTQPLEIQRANSAGDLAVENARNQGAIQKQELVNKGATDAAGAGYEALRSLVSGGGLGAGSHVSIPKVGSFSSPAEHAIPTGLSSTLTAARGNFTARPDPTTQAQLSQAIANVFAAHPAPDNLKEFVHHMILDPGSATMTLDDALRASGSTDVTPEEHQVMEELLSIARGK